MEQINVTLDPAKPLAMLQSCPAYQPSPLSVHKVGTHDVWVKDETQRMGLGAFKAMGGVYAVAELLVRECGTSIQDLTSPEARDKAAGVTFVCASAGNHGMAVAAGAMLFGAGCRIHLADTVPACVQKGPKSCALAPRMRTASQPRSRTPKTAAPSTSLTDHGPATQSHPAW